MAAYNSPKALVEVASIGLQGKPSDSARGKKREACGVDTPPHDQEASTYSFLEQSACGSIASWPTTLTRTTTTRSATIRTSDPWPTARLKAGVGQPVRLVLFRECDRRQPLAAIQDIFIDWFIASFSCAPRRLTFESEIRFAVHHPCGGF